MDILERYRGKRILIWGYGREGKSTEAFFKKHPVAAAVEISEAKPDEIEWDAWDYVFKSPGIRLTEPVWERLAEAGFPTEKLTSQTELFVEAFRDRVVGITGTKGKSTTTSLTHHVLQTCMDGREAFLVGNIGVPCLDYYDAMAEGDGVAVFELSCHQLAYSRVSPHVAIFLNLYEDHLDFYGDRATYFSAKRHITEFQDKNDFLYLGTDVPELATQAQIVHVSEPYEDTMMHLPGAHNRYNAAFADAVARERFGCDPAAIRGAIEEFPGLPHRLQYIGTVNHVRYYDDSISTIPEATIRAVESLPEVATVLVGGMDREIDYSLLIDYIPKQKQVNFICMYESGQRVYDEVNSAQPGGVSNLHRVTDLAEAVMLAKKITPSGHACVLSPAAASYGYFKNFEERGDRFKELVGEESGKA